MSMMKRWLEDISCDMGLDGEINEEVMAEGQRQLEGGQGCPLNIVTKLTDSGKFDPVIKIKFSDHPEKF